MTSVLGSQIAFAGLATALLLLVSLGLYLRQHAEAAALIALAGPVVAAWGVQEFLRQVLYVERRLKAALLNDAISYGGQLSAIVVASLAGVLTPVLAFAIIAATSLIAAGFGLIQIRQSLAPRLNWAAFRRDSFENWHFGRWVTGAAILLGVVDLATVWLVAGFVSVTAGGAWRAVTALMGPTHILLKTMDTTLTPIAASVVQREGVPGLRRFIWKVVLLTGPAMLGWCLLVSAFPASLLAFFYGHEYAAYAWLLPFGALSYALAYSNKVVTIGLVSRRLSRPIFNGQLLQRSSSGRLASPPPTSSA